ncbi:hypothetical protein E4V01_14975 [Methylorubrum sp. Q1]|uniref:hypothetical protein n=1 Tax=Methylorubrum sp. Q1 TaxID=2562453 RepID=UPI0010767FCF|nr:hypothetical protein [Methylorubrum sp. Q1]TFZ57598.1 hypothetical protein E4V01_14975 [Methylorubrum sp. Q1]
MKSHLLKQITVWRKLSPSRVIRYNCMKNLHTKKFRVYSCDFVEPDLQYSDLQERTLVETILMWNPEKKGEPKWFDDLEEAILAHDRDFEN